VLLQRGRRQARGQLACLGSADPVRDREQRRLTDVRVLVVAPPPARVGRCGAPLDSHASYLSSVSPTRTMSPGVSRFGCFSRIPFRYVPFVEPMSSSQTPSRRGSTLACCDEAYSSCSSWTSFWAPRPSVSADESSSHFSPSSSAG